MVRDHVDACILSLLLHCSYSWTDAIALRRYDTSTRYYSLGMLHSRNPIIDSKRPTVPLCILLWAP